MPGVPVCYRIQQYSEGERTSTKSTPLPCSLHLLLMVDMVRRRSHLCLLLLLTSLFAGSEATHSAGTLAKQYFSSLLKWATTSSPRIPQTDGGDILEFENGYVVETLVEGNKLGMEPYTIRVSPEGELLAVDSTNSNIVRITPPLSQYSRARLVAGSFQGYTGHVDGKPSDARFNHPKGVTMDEKGNTYVADIANLAIRKIGEAGVTTIAGGKSNVAGYRDGPSEDAKFSNDFDVLYVGSTCSLLVIDRGNAAIRQISLQQDDCDYHYSSISTSDVIMVACAVLVGYVSCLLQHGFGSLFEKKKPDSSGEYQNYGTTEKPSLHVETLKEDVDAGWPSLGRLLYDLSRSAVEVVGNAVLSLFPQNLSFWRSKKGGTPLRDHGVTHEERMQPPLLQKQKNPLLPPHTMVAPDASSNFTPPKLQKASKLPMFKDPSVSTKHRSSKRQDFGDLYGTAEAQEVVSKIQKERMRYRHRDKSGEVSSGNTGVEQKAAELKPLSFADPKVDHFNIRSKYGNESAFNF